MHGAIPTRPIRLHDVMTTALGDEMSLSGLQTCLCLQSSACHPCAPCICVPGDPRLDSFCENTSRHASEVTVMSMQQQKLPLEDHATMPATQMINCRIQANARISRRTGNIACKLRVKFELILFRCDSFLKTRGFDHRICFRHHV
jgi:hypothetical protein